MNTIDAIKEVLEAKIPFDTYDKLSIYLKDVKFMFFDIINPYVDNILISINNPHFYIDGLCDYSNIIFLDRFCCKSGASKIRVSNRLNFDVNLSTHIKNLFFNKKCDASLYDLIHDIKKNKMQISIGPTIFENSYNQSGMNSIKKSYETLLAFSMLDRNSYDSIKNGNFDSNPISQDYVFADNIWGVMRKSKNENNDLEKHKILFCLLSKMYLLKWDNTSRNKEIDLLNFALDDLNVYCENELFFCMKYLENDKNIKPFFDKVQPNSKNTIKKIENIAWDFLHIRLMENSLAVQLNENNVYYLYYFATADKALHNIIKYNPINKIALYDSKVYPVRKHNTSEIIGLDLYNSLHNRNRTPYLVSKLNKLYIELKNEINKNFN